ncbi:MAG: RtcB family protein [Parachlamydiaceae bacterium]|nr:RtcB family protein [Parachlamydiaceae bacterium]
MSNLKKIAPATYELPQEGGMLVPGLIIANEELLQDVSLAEPLNQVRNVAYLPGIVGHSIAMPDMHWGYGFPIGGVAAVDAEEGVISPGGVGYDINCGVRLAIIPERFKNLSSSAKQQILSHIFQHVPSGVGGGHKGHLLTDEDYAQIAVKGARWSIEHGYGFPLDLEHMESHGVIEGANIANVSAEAKARGRAQLGSIGSGNHFVEIGEISQLFLPEVAAKWGIEQGQTYVLIHSGSRGFGHQICQDTLNIFVKKGLDQGLPDKQLVAAPIRSKEGRDYFAAMATAANFAFNNRQQILHGVRRACHQVLGIPAESIRLIYDVCHNIAKFESHRVDGKLRRLCVHRKGATRAFGKGAKELSSLFQETGQPVLVPGDMGRASYLMVGLGNALTWSSACHGAGRAQSRHQALKMWSGKDPIKHMRSVGVEVMAHSARSVAEEMPNAYKDVDVVVQAVQEAQLANMVARLKPHMVIKG